MLTDEALRCSAAPISSAIAMNRPSKISSRTGSAGARVARRCVARRVAGQDAGCPPRSSRAVQPGSTTVVEPGSMISAGPTIRSPAASRGAFVKRRGVQFAGQKQLDRCERRRRVGRRRPVRSPASDPRRSPRRGAFDDQRIVGGEAEASAVRLRERGAHCVGRAERERRCRDRRGHSAVARATSIRIAVVRDALRDQRCARVSPSSPVDRRVERVALPSGSATVRSRRTRRSARPMP